MLLCGQWVYWTGAKGHLSQKVSSTREDAVRDVHRLSSGFEIEAVERSPFPGGGRGDVLVRVYLVNRTGYPVNILGGSSGCSPWGCLETVTQYPQLCSAGGGHWLELKVKWLEVSKKPLFVRLFTDRSLTETLDLKVSTDSVKVDKHEGL